MELRLAQADAEKERVEKLRASDKLQAEKQTLSDDLEKMESELQKIQDSQESPAKMARLKGSNTLLAAALDAEKKERAADHAANLQRYEALKEELEVSGRPLMTFSCFLSLDEGGDPMHHKHCRTLTGMPSVETLVQ